MTYIAYVMSNGIGNPWAATEVHEVTKAGLPVRVYTLRPPDNRFFKSEWAQKVDRETAVLYPIDIPRTFTANLLAPIRFGGRWAAALANALFGEREHARARLAGLAHLAVAAELATRLKSDPPACVYCQWCHSNGTVGMYLARLLGVPFGFTGHAADLFRERCALKDKVRAADTIGCISTFHRDLYLGEGADPAALRLAYCGIDTSMFTPDLDRPFRPGGVLRVLSSGRLVEKKGFDDLIRACARLKARGVPFRCTIAGSGPLLGELRALAETEGVAAELTLTGEPILQEDLPAFMRSGDVYALACKWAKDRDVDGLPQMLMESMACGVPSVSTRLVGIPDLVIDGETGLLVEPEDPDALADALERLGGDEALARRLARAGREHVLNTFDLRTAVAPTIAYFRRFFPSTAPAERAEARVPEPAGAAP